MMKKRSFSKNIWVFMLIITLFACGTPEHKRMRFFNKGLKLFEKEDFVKASIEFKNALQIDPEFSEGYYMLGRIEMKNNNFKGAFSNHSKAVSLKPDNLKAQYELGRIYLVAQNLDEAEKKATLILEKEPKNEDGLVLKSSVLLAKRKFDEAQSLLEGLVKNKVTRPEIYLMLARISSEMKKRPEHVEARLKEGISLNPKDMGLHRALVQLYLNEKNIEKATDIYKKIITIAPENTDYKLGLADLHWNNKSIQEAVNVLEQMIQSDRENEDFRLKVARFYLGKKEMDRAIQTLKGGIEANKNSYKLKLGLSDIYKQTKEVEQAITLLKNVIQEQKDPTHPGAVAAKMALAKIAIEKKEIDKAMTYTEEVLKDNPKNIEAHFILGNILLEKKDGLKAITSFRLITAEQPLEMIGYIKLAQAHYINKEKSLAVDTLKNGLKNIQTSREISQALVSLLMEEKKTEDVFSHLSDMIQKNPDDMRFRLDLADYHVFMNEPLKAIPQYESVITKIPNAPLPYQRLSQLYSKEKKYDEALKIIEKGLSQIPDSKELIIRKVQVLLNGNKLDQATALCQKYITLNEKDAFFYHLLGRVSEVKKSYKEAENLFLKAAELKPDWVAPHQSLTKLYLFQGRKAEAESRLKKLLAENPENLTASISLAQIYEDSKEYGKAKQVYQQVISKNDQIWLAANNLAYLLLEYPETDSDYQKALELAKKAHEGQTENPVVLDTLGWVYYKLNNISLADTYLKKALTQDPLNQVMKYHMGMVLVKQGKISDARRELETALEDKNRFQGREEAEKTLEKLKGNAAS